VEEVGDVEEVADVEEAEGLELVAEVAAELEVEAEVVCERGDLLRASERKSTKYWSSGESGGVESLFLFVGLEGERLEEKEGRLRGTGFVVGGVGLVGCCSKGLMWDADFVSLSTLREGGADDGGWVLVVVGGEETEVVGGEENVTCFLFLPLLDSGDSNSVVVAEGCCEGESGEWEGDRGDVDGDGGGDCGDCCGRCRACGGDCG
jgi:hypothetical protein